MRRLSRNIRLYFLITLMIYIITIVLSFLVYFLLIFIEKHIPAITVCIYAIGETILSGLNLFSIPLRYLLPNLTDDEYYLILVNSIITTFAFSYAYLFYVIHPDLFTSIPSSQNIIYLQWLDLQRHRFQETRRAA